MKKFSLAFIPFFFFAFQNEIIAQSGSRDLTFGVNGRFIQHQKFNYELAQDVAITSDGKILVLANSDPNYYGGFYLLRFLSEGTLDSSFGDQGKVLIMTDYENYYSLAVDDSDRILVLAENNFYLFHVVELYRFFPDGSIDTSFNVIEISGDADNSFLIQHDGKIITAVSDEGNYFYSTITSINRWNENGLIDSTFVETELNTEFNFPLSIAEQNDNKLLIAGTSDSNLFVMRLMPDGLPDNSFGVNGTTLIDEGGNEVGQDVAVTTDGKIYITGYSETSTGSSFTCWRLSADGNSDPAFGNNGLVTLHTGLQHNWGSFVFANENSTVIVGGSVYNGATNDPVLYKLLDDGSIDAGYGSDGVAGKTFTCSKSIELNAVKMPDENILVCGTQVDNGNILPAISKFSPGGIVDSAFGINGTVSVAIRDSEYVDAYESIYDFAFLPDGKILAGGVANDVTLFRLSQDGVPDSSYGKNGLLVPGAQAQDSRVILAYNNNTSYLIENFQHLIYGYETFFIIDGLEGASDFTIHKFNPDGTPDSSYGDFGVLHPLIAGHVLSQCCTAIVQPDGKLLLAGFTSPSFGFDIFLLRLNNDGSVDASFGNQGIIIFDFSIYWERTPFIALDNDGKIIFQNYLADQNSSADSLRTLRLMPDGSSDASFGNNGTSKVLLGYEYYSNMGLALDPDHKIISLIYNLNTDQSKVLRLNSDGTIDDSFGINGYWSLNAAHFSGPPLMCTQPDGKILCVGNSDDIVSITASRLLESGTFDPTFGTNGVAVFDTLLGGVNPHAIHLQSDGKIVISGIANYGYYMARVLNDIETGIEKNSEQMKLQIFPNPCIDKLAVQFPFTAKEATKITIRDIAGKKIGYEKIIGDANQLMINVQSLPTGLYLLTVKTHDQSSTVKFVKQ